MADDVIACFKTEESTSIWIRDIPRSVVDKRALLQATASVISTSGTAARFPAPAATTSPR